MCGIFGYVSFKKKSFHDDKLLDNLFKSLKHRGPDGKGHEVLNNDNFQALLGHTRLSIIDLREIANQPMVENQRYFLTYNGEVYNYLEIRKELIDKGYDFKTNSDTEVVLKALIEWKDKAIDRFIGMFAFVFIDTEENNIIVGRDHFGIKPLYYSFVEDTFFFASEINTLLRFAPIKRTIDYQQVYDYLIFGSTDIGESSFFNDIKRIKPAHMIRLTSAKQEQIQYWDLSLRTQNKHLNLKDEFLSSIKLHLRSDVPLSSSLSGGIDSSAVVCSIKELNKEANLETFSFVEDNFKYSEEKWIQHVLNHTQFNGNFIKANENELINDIDELIKVQGEPFGSTSIYIQNRVFKEVNSKGIKVSLDGQGADEIFGGYPRYIGNRLHSLLIRGRLLSFIKLFKNAAQLPELSYFIIFKKLLASIVPNVLKPILKKINGTDFKPNWLNAQYLEQRGISFVEPKLQRKKHYGNHLKSSLHESLFHRGLPELLRFCDRNSMKYSVEARVPFLNKNLVEKVFALDESKLINNSAITKFILRDELSSILPREITERKDKIGFMPPEEKWIKALIPWIDETFSEIEEIPVLNKEEVLKTWENIKQGKVKFNHQVWRWINYIRWSKIYNIEY